MKIIASVDVSNSDWCGLDFDVYINDNGMKRSSNAQSCDDSITFNVPLAVGESVRICANGNDNDLGGCETVTNNEKKQPERVSIDVS